MPHLHTPAKRVAQMLPLALLGAVTALAGCTVPETTTSGPYHASRAYFAAYPERLLETAAATCSTPSDTVVRPRRGWVECHRLMPPEATAAAILRYDGTVADLPQLVISLRSDPSDGGYVVTNENYLRIPQTDGSAVHVVQPDPRVSRAMQELFRKSGGKVLAPGAG